jgi:hypothetical protein
LGRASYPPSPASPIHCAKCFENIAAWLRQASSPPSGSQ